MKKVMIMALTLVMFWGMSYHHASAAKSVTESEVSSQLNNFMKQYVGNKWTGSYMNATQCKGFATMIFDKIFDLGGKTIGTGSTIKNSTNWKLNELNSTVDCLGTVYNASESDYANLLKQAKPGDFLQTRRRSSGNPHSMIVVSVSDSQVEIFDCNSEGDLLVRHYYQSFSAFKSRNIGVSLYRSKHYNVNASITPTKPTVNASTSGSNVTLTWGACSGATHYWLEMYAYGASTSFINTSIGNVTSYTVTDLLPGTYTAFVQSANSSKSVVSDGVTFTIADKPLDVGTNFFGYIVNVAPWKMLTNDKDNVTIRKEKQFTDDQVWRFERQSDGSYVIRTWVDGKVLGADGASGNVLVKNENSDWIKWYIVQFGDNYEFRNKASGKLLEVAGGETAEGSNVQQWERNNSNAQIFTIWHINNPSAETLNVIPGTSTTPTTFSWHWSSQARNYDLYIYKDGKANGKEYMSQMNVIPTGCSVNLPAGYYEAFVTAVNQAGSAGSAIVSFNVEAVKYEVKYNANGGTGAPGSQTKIHDQVLSLTNDKPSKNYTITYNANGGTVGSGSKIVSCTFRDWNTNANGSGSSYNAGGSYTANAATTLYAQWSNPTAGNLETPTRSGYTFAGWYTAESGGSQVTSGTTITGNTTLYAHWNINKYIISYNANGGSSAPGSQTKEYNATLTLSNTKPTRNGYDFLGWSTSSTATSATYQPGGSYTDNSDVTLYAVWKQNSSIIRGNVTSYDIDKNDTVTVRLLNSTGTSEVRKVQCKAGTSAQMAYEMKDVQAGSYILEVSKEGHVTRICEVTVGENSVTQDVKICLIGDVTGDGKVNTRDLNRLYAHVNGTNTLSGYEFACGDVTGDGKLNTRDLNRLYAHISEINPLW